MARRPSRRLKDLWGQLIVYVYVPICSSAVVERCSRSSARAHDLHRVYDKFKQMAGVQGSGLLFWHVSVAPTGTGSVPAERLTPWPQRILSDVGLFVASFPGKHAQSRVHSMGQSSSLPWTRL